MLVFDEHTTKLLESAYRGSDVSRRRRMAFDALHLSAGDTVIDIGCGNGMLTEEIARAVGQDGCVVGIDPSVEMLGPARQRCADFTTVRIVEGSAERLPLKDAEADKAVAVQVLEYLPDVSAAIVEARRVLRPGGRFVAVDTGFKTLDWFSDDEVRMSRVLTAWDHHYTEARVAAIWPTIARRSGFTSIDVQPFTFCDVTLRPDGIAHMLMHLMSRYASDNGYLSEQETSDWFQEQLELARLGRFFFSLTYYLMVATRE